MNHINVELTKKLKDAGFPMRESYDQYAAGYLKWEKYLEWNYYIDGKYWAIPTLSELMEACLKIPCQFKLHCWTHGFVVGFPPEAHEDDMEICSTPEEAVANLWMFLNK